MKRNHFGKGILRLAIALSTIPVFTGCVKDGAAWLNLKNLGKKQATNSIAVGTSTSQSSVQKIYAGKTIEAGTVVYDDIDTNGDKVDDALQVTLTTTNGWELTGVNFFIGKSLTELPTNKSGNPIPGQFPYKSGTLAGVLTYQFTIPFSKLGFSCPSGNTGVYYVAAHCDLRKLTADKVYQTESGWGDGQRCVLRGNWAMYNLIFVTCSVNDTPSPATTETAFAYDGDPSGCFQQYSQFLDNPQRWGWTNGSYGPGTYTFKLYAGAGLCDVSKGVLVGTVTMVYDGATAKVTYNLTGTDPKTGISYALREAHLYVGNDEFPRITNGNQAGDFTIAPGKFPYKASNLTGQTQVFTVPKLSGKVYLIAHAVVYGLPE